MSTTKLVIRASDRLKALVEMDPTTGHGTATCGGHRELFGHRTAGEAAWVVLRSAGAADPPPVALTVTRDDGTPSPVGEVRPLGNRDPREFQPILVQTGIVAPELAPRSSVAEALDVVLHAAS